MKTYLIRRLKDFPTGNPDCTGEDGWIVEAKSMETVVKYFGFEVEWATVPSNIGVKLPRSSFSVGEFADSYEKGPVHLAVGKNSKGDVYFGIRETDPFEVPD